MPTIPRLDGPSAGTRAVSTAKQQQLPNAAFNQGILSGAAQGGMAFIDAKQKVDTQKAEADAENAVLSFENQQRELFYNKDSGYFNTQGIDAYDGSEAAGKGLADIQRTTGVGLSPEAARTYKRVTDAHLQRGRTAIGKHAANGSRMYQAATKEAVVSNSFANASAFYADDLTTIGEDGKTKASDFSIAMITGEDAVIEGLRLKGIPDGPVMQNAIDDFRAGMYASKIQGALNAGDVERAAKDFAYTSDLISDPKVAAQLKTQIDKKIDDQYIADKVTAIYKSTDDHAERVKLARAEPDGDKRKEILQQLENYNSVDERVKTAEQSTMYSDYSNKVSDESGSFSVSDIPLQHLQKLSPSQVKSLKQIENDNARGGPAYARHTNIKVWDEAMKLLATDPGKIDDPYIYVNDMSESHYQQFAAAWLETKTGETMDSEKLTHITTVGTAVSKTIDTLLGDPFDKDKKTHREFDLQFRNMAQTMIDAEENRLGREMSPTELNSMMYELSGTVTIPGRFYGTNEIDLADSEQPLTSNLDALTALNIKANPTTLMAMDKFRSDEDARPAAVKRLEQYNEKNPLTPVAINSDTIFATHLHLFNSDK